MFKRRADKYSKIKLFDAVDSNNTLAVKYLLQKQFLQNGVTPGLNDTPGEIGISYEEIEAMENEAMKNGKQDIEDIDIFLASHTPLHAACYIGNEQIVQMLLEAKARVDKTDEDGFTPLHYIFWGYYTEEFNSMSASYPNHSNHFLKNDVEMKNDLVHDERTKDAILKQRFEE